MSSVLMVSAIAAICSGSLHKDACEKGVEAATKQSGYYQQFEMVEDKAQEIAKDKVQEDLGKNGTKVLTVGASATGYLMGKEAKFQTKGGSISDTVVFGASKDKRSINFGWSF